MKINNVNQAIIDLIDMNPSITPSAIASRLGIKKRTTMRWIRALRKDKIISDMCLVSRRHSRLRSLVQVTMTLSRPALKRTRPPQYDGPEQFNQFLLLDLPKSQEWKEFFATDHGEEILVIRDVYSISGGGAGIDQAMVLQGTSREILQDFISEVLLNLEGVERTNTASLRKA